MQRFRPVVIARSYRLRNIQLQRSGFYNFLIKNTINLLITLGTIIVLIFFINKYVIDFKELIINSMGSINSFFVFGSYYVSQSLFGFLPTNIFIIWLDAFKHPVAMLLVLSLLSYAGGVTSYLIGYYAGNNSMVNNYINNSSLNIPHKAEKWGGLFVMIAAFFPLPYSLVCLSSGLVKLPAQSFLLWSLARIPKFFVMAWIIHLAL